jgi:large subunit ribosomal protein L13
MRSYMANKATVEQKWFLVDAEGQVLGRLAARLATILQGKHKPTYTPHVDTGDYVVVINAEKVRVTGSKMTQKMYKRYSGYPSGQKQWPLAEALQRHPERVLEQAVRRMLPKTKLGDRMYMKLKVYAGAEHPHQAQTPEPLALSGGR